jgi:hypothetical protein
MPTFDPMYDARVQIGTSALVERTSGSPVRLLRDESLFDLSLEYGLPGKAGYAYTRPFDYFNLRLTASSTNGLESVTSHGLLAGKSYGAGENGRGADCYGRGADDVLLRMPVGTLIKDFSSGEVIADLTRHEQRALIAKGESYRAPAVPA